MQISSTLDKKCTCPSSSPPLSPENAPKSWFQEARQISAPADLAPPNFGRFVLRGRPEMVRRSLFRNEQLFHRNESPEEHSETLVPNKSHCQRRDKDHFPGALD